MKKQLCKCRGKKPDGSGYTDCSTLFILDRTESCPNCHGIDWVEFAQVEIPGIEKAIGLLDIVLTDLNKIAWPTDMLGIKAGIAAAMVALSTKQSQTI